MTGRSSTDAPTYKNCWGDIGHTSPLTLYSRTEVEQILNTSRRILNSNLPGGCQISSSFRSGGWVTSDDIQRAVLGAGFTIDSSAVPVNFAAPGSSLHALHDGTPRIWQGITDESQPYEIGLGADGKLKEVPNNFGLADYRTKAEMHTKMTNWALPRQGPTMVHIGFHEETVNGLMLYHACAIAAACADPACNHMLHIADQDHLHKLSNAASDGLLDDWSADAGIWNNIEFLTVEQAADLFLPSA